MTYQNVTDDNIRDIEDLINDNDRVLYGDNLSKDYSHDEFDSIKQLPDVVVKVNSTEEVSKVIIFQ